MTFFKMFKKNLLILRYVVPSHHAYMGDSSERDPFQLDFREKKISFFKFSFRQINLG